MKVKKLIALTCSAVMAVTPLISSGAGNDISFLGGSLVAFADSVSVNATEATVYGLASWAEEFISVPEDMAAFQIKVTGASSVSYEVRSGSVTVSSSGLVEPAYTTYYWYGNVGYSYKLSGQEPSKVTKSLRTGDSVVRVTADGQVFDIKIHVQEYSSYYAEQKIDERIAEYVTDGMSDYEKMVEACKYCASFDYSPYYSGGYSMVIAGGGDCWASTDLIIKFLGKLGIKAWSRNGNRDAGAGSGHMNAMAVSSDGKYYELEAGYSGTAPRYYDVTERASLFSYRYNSTYGGCEVYQYDGETVPEKLIVPDTIGGYPVVSVGASFIAMENGIKEVVLPDTVANISNSAFNSCYDLEKINLPASLVNIGNFVFTNDNKLTQITADKGCAFAVRDGVIYDRDMTKLLYAPTAVSLTIPDTVTEIADYAFYYNSSLTSVTIPGSVKKIGEGAFVYCTALGKVKLGEGVEEIGRAAFAQCSSLAKLVIPVSVKTLGDDVFHAASGLTIEVPEGSVSETYAKDNSVAYKVYKVVYGDVNSDGDIGVLDLALMKQYILGWDAEIYEKPADVVPDGNIDLSDIAALKQYILGWNVKLGA